MSRVPKDIDELNALPKIDRMLAKIELDKAIAARKEKRKKEYRRLANQARKR